MHCIVLYFIVSYCNEMIGFGVCNRIKQLFNNYYYNCYNKINTKNYNKTDYDFILLFE